MKTVKVVITRAVVFLAVAGLIVAGYVIYFHESWYRQPEVRPLELRNVATPMPAAVVINEESPDQRKGKCLIDLSSDNDFRLEEFSSLLSRVLAHGYTLSYLENRTQLEKELGVVTEPKKEEPAVPKETEKKDVAKKEPEKLPAVVSDKPQEKKVEPADAFIIIAPKKRFSLESATAIKEFAKRGGKILLIGDPARPSELGWLALFQFGIMFEKDYLYNMKNNEGNYRNIFVTEFADNDITRGLRKVVFYTAGSITPSEKGIAFAGKDTQSSLSMASSKLAPIALVEDSRVLAVNDLTVFIPPNHAVFDNGQLIRNIADWLTRKARSATG